MSSALRILDQIGRVEVWKWPDGHRMLIAIPLRVVAALRAIQVDLNSVSRGVN